MTAIDAAGVIAAAVALSTRADPSPEVGRDLASESMLYARTDEMRYTLRAVAGCPEPPPYRAALNAPGTRADAPGVLALVVLAARHHAGIEAIRWAIRTGIAPDPVAALTGALAGARHPSRLAAPPDPRIDRTEEIRALASALPVN